MKEEYAVERASGIDVGDIARRVGAVQSWVECLGGCSHAKFGRIKIGMLLSITVSVGEKDA